MSVFKFLFNKITLLYLNCILLVQRHRRLFQKIDLISAVLSLGYGVYARNGWWIAVGFVMLACINLKTADRSILLFFKKVGGINVRKSTRRK